jgi:uncharacterized protein
MAIIIDEVVPAGRPWGRAVRQGEILRLVDLKGQQAVDFLCFDAKDPRDRYSATNCPQIQNQCNGYNPTPIRATIYRPS